MVHYRPVPIICLSRDCGTPFGENVSPVFPRKAFHVIFVAFEKYIGCFVVKCVGTEKEQNYTHTYNDNVQFSGYRDVFDWLLFARENSKPSNNHF